MKILSVLMLLFVFLGSNAVQSQQDNRNSVVHIYIDCPDCDHDYIRSEITFVNYAIDRKNADVYILITHERRGGGGHIYSMAFTGRHRFDGQKNELTFTTQADDTHDQIRQKMVHSLKLGLIQFIADTPYAEHISISYSEPQIETVQKDPWNSWVFRTQFGGELEGEKSTRGNDMHAMFGAERITEAWKIRLGAYTKYREEVYQTSGDEVIGISRVHQFEGMAAKSLTNHWSIGAGAEVTSSTYSNLKSSTMAYPMIEYSVFPYSQSTRREFRIYYGFGVGYNNYFYTTIYDVDQETLWGQRAGINVETKQEWGRIDLSVEGFNYFPEVERNHVRVSGHVSLHLVRGLALAVHGGVSAIHDQIALPKGGASDQDILLRIRELETQYNYWFGLGFEFTFGSVYNNVVNSRFGN